MNKIVREFITEKFTEDSDPIEDLGIGMYKFWRKAYEEIGETLPSETYKKYFNDGDNVAKKDNYRNEKVYILFYTLDSLSEKIEPDKAFKIALDTNYGKYHFYNNKLRQNIFNDVKKVLKKHFFVDIPEETVFEKFTEESDPIKDLGIGINFQLKKLAKFLEIELNWNSAKVTVNDDKTLTYMCMSGQSVIPDIKQAIEKFGLGGKMKVQIDDDCSRSYQNCLWHYYLISFKKKINKYKL